GGGTNEVLGDHGQLGEGRRRIDTIGIDAEPSKCTDRPATTTSHIEDTSCPEPGYQIDIAPPASRLIQPRRIAAEVARIVAAEVEPAAVVPVPLMNGIIGQDLRYPGQPGLVPLEQPAPELG